MANGKQVLDLPMHDEDSGATSVRDYLGKLLLTLWEEQDEFSGKRPFGNSDWSSNLMFPLIEAGFIPGTIDEDGYIDDIPGDGEMHGNTLIRLAIDELVHPT